MRSLSFATQTRAPLFHRANLNNEVGSEEGEFVLKFLKFMPHTG